MRAKLAAAAFALSLAAIGINVGRGEQSAHYAFDYAEQNNGGGQSSSAHYDSSDALQAGGSEAIPQGSGTYSVASPAQIRLETTNGSGNGYGTTVLLKWEANGTPGIQGYDVFRSNSPQGPFTKVNAGHLGGTTFSDPNLGNGAYYYQIYVIDSGGGMTLWKTIAGSVKGVKTEVWVDFAWNGDQTGDPLTPYRSLATAIPWVETGGAVALQPGTSHDTMRITKPMLLINVTPGQPVRIGASGG